MDRNYFTIAYYVNSATVLTYIKKTKFVSYIVNLDRTIIIIIWVVEFMFK